MIQVHLLIKIKLQPFMEYGKYFRTIIYLLEIVTKYISILLTISTTSHSLQYYFSLKMQSSLYEKTVFLVDRNEKSI